MDNECSTLSTSSHKKMMLMATRKYRNRFQLSDGIKYGSKASIDATKNGKIRLERFDLFESAEAEMPERSFLQIRVGSEKFEKYISLPFTRDAIHSLVELLTSIQYPERPKNPTVDAQPDELRHWKDLGVLHELTFGVEEPKEERPPSRDWE